MTDHPIPSPALWTTRASQRIVEHKAGHGLAAMACPGCNLYANPGECDCMPPPDCSMCDPDFLAVAPARRWFDPVLDFAAGCVLALAMSVMEEPKRAGRMSWRRRMVHAKAIASSLIGLGLMALVLWASKP